MRIPSNSARSLVLVAAVAFGCGDEPTTPVEEPAPPVRTLVVHDRSTGENLLWNTDGSQAGSLAPATRGMLPIATHAGEGAIALLANDAIVVTTLGRPEEIDTVIRPAPASLSLASFSNDGRYLAVVSYAPTPGLLLHDRANRITDTLDLGGADPALPPIFSPDDRRIALITVTQLSMLATFLVPDEPGNTSTTALRASRIINRPIFGWPRWIDGGIRMAFVRVADAGPDTLLVASVFPDDPESFLEEHYRALMAPEADTATALDIGVLSTYALTGDGEVLALGAIPGSGTSLHGVFVVTPDSARVRTLVARSGTTTVFPLFIRE